MEMNHNDPKESPREFRVKKKKLTLVRPAAENREKGSLYFLSHVDDVMTITRTIYCFKSNGRGNESAEEVINDALSKVLVHYYPLAGRLVVSPEGRYAVNCPSEGVLLVEADADCGLNDVDFSKPDKAARSKLAVYDVLGVPDKFEHPLMAQVTKFNCGGFVLGISFNHVFADGQATVEFIISWAEIVRGLPISVPPFLDRTILKARTPLRIQFHHPEFDPIEAKSPTTDDFSDEAMTNKYFKFTPQMIQRAKSAATTASPVKRCSTYEALSAFVWRTRYRVLKVVPDQLTRILWVVNTRGFFEPPLPKGYFGNALNFTPAHSLAGELVGNPLSYALAKIQEAIRRVMSDGYLRSTIDYREATRAKRPGGYYKMVATMWSRLPFSATDFGWGEPILSEPVELPSDDSMVLLDHPTEKGSFNVFVALPGSAMERFEELVEEELCK